MIRELMGCFASAYFAIPALPAASVQSLDMVQSPAGTMFLRWPGAPGRTYFLQTSSAADPLGTWLWAPLIEIGAGGEISYELTPTSASTFFRLKYADQLPGPEETPETADYDNDGLSNSIEIQPPPPRPATDPLDPDTDHDGLPDGWEIAHNLNPTDATDASANFPRSGATNLEAFEAGVQSDPDATLTNKDGDAIDDALDAAPQDKIIDWERPAIDRFVAVAMPESYYDLTSDGRFGCLELLDNYDVLVSGHGVEGFWKLDPAAFVSVAGPDVTYNDPFWDNDTITRENRGAVGMAGNSILYRADIDTIDDRFGGMILAPPAGAAFSLWQKLAEAGTNCYRVTAIGGDRSGRAIGYLTTMYGEVDPHEDQVYGMTASGGTSTIAPICILPHDGPNGVPGPERVSVSKNGWIAAHDKLFAPDGSEKTMPGIGEWESVRCQDLPNGRASVSNWGAPSGIYLMDEGEHFTSGSTFGGHRIVASTQWGAFIDAANNLWTRDRTSDGRTDSWLPLEEWAGLRIANFVADGWYMPLESSTRDCGMLIQLTKTGSAPKVFALLPLQIDFEEIAGYDNVFDHIDPWEPHEKKGLRIFPGFKTPVASDVTLRAKLTVVVKSAPGLQSKTVHLKAFDIDDGTFVAFDKDPITGNAVIDTNGPAGGDNLQDYMGTATAGEFWNDPVWGTATAEVTLDNDGKAHLDFRVGMQPGNNYRIVASLFDETMYADAQTSDPAADAYLGPELSQTGSAPATPPLTVWRRLWVENDSMEAIPLDQFGYKRNDLSWDLNPPAINALIDGETNTLFFIPQISDQSSFDTLEHGRIMVQSIEHPVIGSGHYGISPYFVSVPDSYPNVPLGPGFRLYDDDDFGLVDPPLPRLDLVNEQLKSYFRPAFVEVVDAIDFNPPNRREVPFHVNEDVSTNGYGMSSTVVANVKDLQDRKACWVCPVTAAYQGPQTEDKDPNSDESTLYGETATYGADDHSTVFVEACRELFEVSLRDPKSETVSAANVRLGKWISASLGHEMGHQPGHDSADSNHNEGGLMSAAMDGVSSITPENAEFRPVTVRRFRKSNRWSE